MMRRIKAGSSDITDRSCQFFLTIDGIDRTQCIAVIFHQPEIMFFTEISDCLKVKRISKCVCQHDCLCLWRICSLQKLRINVVLRNRHIDKNRNCTVLDDRRYGCRKTCRNCDNLISWKDLTLFEKRGSQSHKRKKIRGRT